MVVIDGSVGEGGGQILRTSIALSVLTGEGVRVENIRSGRDKPGLRPQHLVAVKASRDICDAEVEGAMLNSTEVSFKPGKVVTGSYRFEIETAGSTMLVLQTLLLPLSMAGDESRVKIEGGTHVPTSPPFEYCDLVWRPTLEKMGPVFSMKLQQAGYYPRGDGRIDVKLKPTEKLLPIKILERGDLKSLKIISGVSNLRDGIANRMIKLLKRRAKEYGVPNKAISGRIERPTCVAQGTYVFMLVEFENAAAGFVGLGEPGKRAEIVAEETWVEAATFLRRKEPIDFHLADQLALPMAFAEGASTLTVSKITSHFVTVAAVIEKFGVAKVNIEGAEGGPGTVTVSPT